MIFEFKEFSSIGEIEDSLDKEISETKSSLGEYLHRLDGIRELVEKKKIRQVILKLAGKKTNLESLGEIKVDNMNIVLAANSSDKLTALESVVRSHQERLLKVQKARESLKPSDKFGDTEGVKFLIVEADGIPERILLRVC